MYLINFSTHLKEEINMRLSVHNGLSHGFNLFEANDCHRSTSNHEAHIHKEEKMEKLVTQRTLGESPMRNLKMYQFFVIGCWSSCTISASVHCMRRNAVEH